MLLRFSVSNFGSIRDRQELSMIASGAIKDEARGLIDAPELKKEKALPAAVIYGANASGKSNFVKALAHMIALVRDSHRRGEPGGGVPLKPFLLDPAYVHEPSVFSVDFLWGGARYAYSFEASRSRFTRESLIVWRGGSRSKLFERVGDRFEFGRKLKGAPYALEKLVQPNTLFVSAAWQNNFAPLSDVFDFFDAIKIDLAAHRSAFEVSLTISKYLPDERITRFMQEIDIGIEGSRVTEFVGDTKGHANQHKGNIIEYVNVDDSMWSALLTTTSWSMFDKKRFTQLSRKRSDGKEIFFDLEDESAGTVQILSIIGPIFQTLDEGGVIIIDEFGSRLHTRAAEMILDLFNNKETNPKGAQLIVATHDTNLLNAKGLRRDQVWFTEKDERGATHLYPLTDIETRKGDNLERGYLQGRYGAIPFAGSIADFKKTL